MNDRENDTMRENEGRQVQQELERQLDVFETSSPSYPLMASLDGCTGLLAEHGDAWFAAWRARLQRFSGAVRPLRRLRVLCHGMDDVSAHPGFFAHDSGKILVNGAAAGLTGPALAELLRRDWQFETEMSCGANVLAMTSPCDEETALDRFAAALLVIDAAAAQNAPLPASAQVLPPPGPAACSIAQALFAPHTALALQHAVGRTSAEYVWAYPPGVPLLAPGEVITPEFIAACTALAACGTHLHHTGLGGGSTLDVLP